jgi:hypothetical protein
MKLLIAMLATGLLAQSAPALVYTQCTGKSGARYEWVHDTTQECQLWASPGTMDSWCRTRRKKESRTWLLDICRADIWNACLCSATSLAQQAPITLPTIPDKVIEP